MQVRRSRGRVLSVLAALLVASGGLPLACSGSSNGDDLSAGQDGGGDAGVGNAGSGGRPGSGGKAGAGGKPSSAGKAGSGSGGTNAGRGGASGSGGESGGGRGGSGNVAAGGAGEAGAPSGGAGGALCDCANGSCETGACICELGWTGDDCNARPASCAALLSEFPNAPSGTYEIDPDGAAGSVARFDAYCDMQFDGGGWTLVMASNAIGPDNQSAGLVAPSSGTYVPATSVVALAAQGVSSQIHIRTRGQPELASITSVSDSLPITNLRGLHVLNDNSGMYSGSATVTDWTGPFATAYHLWHSCGPAPYEGVPGYPNIWWSCNNGNGLHLTSINSGWNSESQQNQDMEVYLR